jgi:hypothetical protein
MRKAGHSGAHPGACPNCITAAEKQRMPWHGSYHDVLAHPKYGADIQHKHDAAIRRGLRSGKFKFAVPLVLAALVSSAHAATKTCPSGTLSPAPATTTGPTTDIIIARAAPALVMQASGTGTATVVMEISCDGTNWAQVTNSSMAVPPSQVVSVLQPTCSYRANVTACTGCSITVVYACSGP